MADENRERARRAWMSVGGFSCTQGFVYSVLYLGIVRLDQSAFHLLSDAELLAALASVVLGLAAVAVLRARAFSPRAMIGWSVLPLAGGALALAGADAALGVSLLQGLLLGFPAGILLCAWGRVLGADAIERSVPEVFIGSALGAAIAFVFAAVPFKEAQLLAVLLPLAGLAFFRALDGSPECASAPGAEAHAPAPDSNTRRLSGRILGGTCVYGLAAGLVETFDAGAGAGSVAYSALMLLLLVIYCLAVLQLFGGRPLLNVRAILPARVEQKDGDAGPLDGAYRLAVLLMMSGFLLGPVLDIAGLPAELLVLSGYLGVSAVLVSLFLVMGRLSSSEALLPFVRGFAALFAGEMAGIAFGDVLSQQAMPGVGQVVAALAGILVLYGFLFLFTERDLRALSVVVDAADRFEATCARIAREAGLSKREAEVLPLALRGRTSERIAAELFISKNTVDTHIRRIYAKCGVRSRQELIDVGERAQREAARG